MTIAKDRIVAALHGWDSRQVSRTTVFVRKDQLESQSLDQLLQTYVDDGWYIIVRKPKDHDNVFGLTFAKDSKYHYGDSNPYFR